MPDFEPYDFLFNYSCKLNIKLELPPLDHKDGKIPRTLKICQFKNKHGMITCINDGSVTHNRNTSNGKTRQTQFHFMIDIVSTYTQWWLECEISTPWK